MGDRDDRRRALGGSAGDSFGVGQGVGMPPGMDIARATPASARDAGVTRSRHAVEIEVGRIGPDPDQPREEFDPESIGRLAESLRAKGQLQPIRVRWDEGRGLYVIVMGERRWRAAVEAGLPTLSCVVHQGPVDPGELVAMQVIENALREDLKPIEQAKAYRKLQELYGWSGVRIAKELSIPQPTVSQMLKLLDLPEPIQAKVEAGEIFPRAAYEISKLEDDADRLEVAERVQAEKLTVTQVADVVKAKKQGRADPPATARIEIKLDGGCRMILAGLPDDRPETIQAKIREAGRVAQRMARAASSEEAA